jgi:hypothetical protein
MEKSKTDKIRGILLTVFLIAIIVGIIAVTLACFLNEPEPYPEKITKTFGKIFMVIFTFVFITLAMSFIKAKEPDGKESKKINLKQTVLLAIIFLLIMASYGLVIRTEKCNAAFERLSDEQKQEYYAEQQERFEKLRNSTYNSW